MEYISDYYDTLDSLPSELQRFHTSFKEIEAVSQNFIANLDGEVTSFINVSALGNCKERSQAMKRIHAYAKHTLIHEAERVQLADTLFDTVQKHVQRLDKDWKGILDSEENELNNGDTQAILQVDELPTNQTSSGDENSSGKKKVSRSERRNGRRNRKENSGTPESNVESVHTEKPRDKPSKPHNHNGFREQRHHRRERDGVHKDKVKRTVNVQESPIDPNEPTYCYCNQVSFGEMIACDNTECEIEWFHYQCVDLKAPPKGAWYCKECQSSVKKHRSR
ncbi:hypothetical protein K7432_018645 [Basidiobolus ranarum]|uniref:Chromatin modification-related protein n=1 Tax=Basidiobolus ranarum TaxID=34480 RepID=A0ABR2VT14_9FUNG